MVLYQVKFLAYKIALYIFSKHSQKDYLLYFVVILINCILFLHVSDLHQHF